MGHPVVINQTPFVFELLHLADEDSRPLLVPLLKATFDIDRKGSCRPADVQLPVLHAGTYHGREPALSSYRYEPEVAFHKPATDVVFIGHACAPTPDAREMDVTVRVGPLGKRLRVFGDRVWFRAAGLLAMSRPKPFDRVPIVYERAYGGWDRTNPDPAAHRVERRNPVGTGFRRSGDDAEILLPNIEDPVDLIRAPGDAPAPAGLGFTSPHWYPRAQLAGPYDAHWEKHRCPLLPEDFDRRHMNGASAGLVASGYLLGNESVQAIGMTPDGSLSFSLPGLPNPQTIAVSPDTARTTVQMRLDTVIIEPDIRRLTLLWRGHLSVRSAHDISEVRVSVANS